jgi:hypothetical protein
VKFFGVVSSPIGPPINERSLVANVFISHRSVDKVEAERLANELRAASHDVALDVWDLKIGDSIVEWMNNKLENANYVAMCYSSSGLAPWMNKEWQSTLARQLNGENIKILPVLLTGGTTPAILADVKFADLVSDWNEGVQLLLRALK